MTDLSKAKLIERVKKLMAMAADGSSPNEAMIAARRARSLMDKHQLSVEDLTQRSSFASKGTANARRFTPHWENVICVAVAQYNDCLSQLVHTTSTEGGAYYQLTFKGFDEDVKIAEYMFCYIIENGKRQCSKHMKEVNNGRYNARIGTSFKDAYATAICAKIRTFIKERKEEAEEVARNSTGQSIMVIKQDLVEQEFGVAKYTNKSRKRGNLDMDDIKAQSQGSKAGNNTPIHTGIETEAKERIA